ncbi:MAG: nucleoside monophosphate kinase [Candidatus Bathyarchaeota archaeon]|nr:MAG: nucleoside monophosphate kinase [Candidatus Bathyarchaeota archaeon]
MENLRILERRNLKTNLIIFGPPGSGKGTYASRLQVKLGIPAIATGDMFRNISKKDSKFGQEIMKYIKNGELVPDAIVINVLRKRLSRDDCRRGFILDGYPRTIKQAKVLEGLAEINAIILLQVPEWIVIERLSSRRICRTCGEVYNIRFLRPKKKGTCDKCGGVLYQRIDDSPKVIGERLTIYEKNMEPLLAFYNGKVPFIKYSSNSIDTPPGVAVAEILQGLKKLKLS